MIIGVKNLGLTLEVEDRDLRSVAIKQLIGLQSKSACVQRNGQKVDIKFKRVDQSRYS